MKEKFGFIPKKKEKEMTIEEKIQMWRERIKEREKGERQERIYPVEELRRPIEKLLLRLKKEIDSGEYKLIVGDDISARIPTLIFEKVIRSVYHEKGYPQPETIFIAGSSEANPDEIANKVDEFIKYNNIIRQGKKLKALIVTEYIETGRILAPLSRALKKINIDFDIAALCVRERQIENIRKNIEPQGQIVYAEQSIAPPPIFGKHHLAGVKKGEKEVFSKALKKQFKDKPKEAARVQKTIQEAREDVKILSEELIEWYKKRE